MKLSCSFQILPKQQDKNKHKNGDFKFDLSVSDVSEKNISKGMYEWMYT